MVDWRDWQPEIDHAHGLPLAPLSPFLYEFPNGHPIFPLCALGMAMSLLPFLPLALFLSSNRRSQPSIRCNDCEELNAARDRRFKRRSI